MRRETAFSMKKLLALLAFCLCLTLVCPAVCEEKEPLLPIDFSAGMEVDPDNYLSDREYQDPTLHIVIEEGREEGCDDSDCRTLSGEGDTSHENLSVGLLFSLN